MSRGVTVRKLRTTLAPVVTLLIFAAALVAVDHVLREYRLRDILQALGEVPSSAIAAGLVLSIVAYVSLVAYDHLAFRFAGHPLPFRRMLVPSFVSFAIANNTPAAVVTGGGVRYAMYRSLGLTVAQAAVVAGFNVVTYAVGLCAIAGGVLLMHPAGLGPATSWELPPGRTLGIVLVSAVLVYLIGARLHPGRVRVFGRELRLPTLTVALEQLAVSAADWLLASSALFVLLESVTTVNYFDFLAIYFAAGVVALVFPIPGGLGVFEAVVLLLRPEGAPAPRVLAALLLYRVVYFLVPLIGAGAVLLVRSLRQAGETARPLHALWHQITGATPHILSFATFLSGAVLLLSGSIPEDQQRLAWLADLLPVAAIEASHFLSSLVGSALVILAWGLERRVRLAYQAARVFFLLGILLSLGRSMDLRLAAVLLVALAVLLAASRHFPRHASLVDEPVPLGWVFAIGAVLIVNLWLGLMIHRSVSLPDQLWWRFALDADTPRILRAAVGASAIGLLFAFARILAHHAPPHAPAGQRDSADRGTEES